MKKYAIVINFYTKPGGAERRFSRVFNHISNSYDDDVTLIINEDGKLMLDQLGINFNKDKLLIVSSGLNNLVAKKIVFLFQLFKLIRKEKIDFVHYAVDPSYCSFFHSLFKWIINTDYSISVLDSNRKSRNDFSFYTFLIWKLSLERAKRIEFLSTGIKSNVLKMFRNVPPFTVSPCSFTDYSKSQLTDASVYDFIFISRLCEGKGVVLFLNSLALLDGKLDSTTKVKVGIFGDGPLKEMVEAYKMRFKNVSIESRYIANPFEVLAHSGIFFSLQDKENYPSQSLLEAFSCGLPAIATDVGETKLLVNNSNGFLVSPSPEVIMGLMLDYLLGKFPKFDKENISKQVKASHSIEVYCSHFILFLTAGE